MLWLTGSRGAQPDGLSPRRETAGLEINGFAVPGEPKVDTIRAGVTLARSAKCEVVVAVGGGSVLDAGKAIAALAVNEGDPLDYLEVVGKGRQIGRPGLPFIALPTTAGTGTEVTRNAVIGSPEHGVKASLRSVHLLPRLALVDPELTHSMPPELTASTGLDALTQLIEPLVSRRANPLTDGLCREGIARAARSLKRAWLDGANAAAREDMALASLCGGLALANAGLGAVHGFAAPLGGMFPVAHGAVCAALLAPVMQANIQALRARDAGHPALARYGEIGCILTGSAGAGPEDAVAWVAQLCPTLGVRGLSALGVPAKDYPAVVEKAAHASSMKGNPIALEAREMLAILEQAS